MLSTVSCKACRTVSEPEESPEMVETLGVVEVSDLVSEEVSGERKLSGVKGCGKAGERNEACELYVLCTNVAEMNGR